MPRGDDAFAPCTSPWKPALARTARTPTRSRPPTTSATRPRARQLRGRPHRARDHRPTTAASSITDANLDRAECAFGAAAYAAVPGDRCRTASTSFAIRAFDKAGNERLARLRRRGHPDRLRARCARPRGRHPGHLGRAGEGEGQPERTCAPGPGRACHAAVVRTSPPGSPSRPPATAAAAPGTRSSSPPTAPRVSLKGLTGRKLKPGAVITIALRRDGKLLQTFHVTIRRTAAPRVR